MKLANKIMKLGQKKLLSKPSVNIILFYFIYFSCVFWWRSKKSLKVKPEILSICDRVDVILFEFLIKFIFADCHFIKLNIFFEICFYFREVCWENGERKNNILM